MKIGVIGSLGVVGGAVCYGFQKLGHDVKQFDLRLACKHVSFNYFCYYSGIENG